MNKGDVVQLKSGGPKMTVTYVDGTHKAENDREVRVHFFDGQGEMDNATLPYPCLMPAVDEPAKRPRRVAKK